MRRLFVIACLVLVVASIFGAITLTMVETITSPARTELLRQLLNEFEATHPGIKVELISPPYESSDQKLIMMLNTKQKVDVFEVRDNFLAIHVNNKNLLDLTEFVKNWDGWNDLIDLAKTVASKVEGKVYYIPYGFFIKALFYRKDILEKNNIPVPQTMQELYEYAKKLTNPAEGKYGFAFRGGPSEHSFSEIVIMSYVPNIDPRPNRGYLTTDGVPYHDTPGGIEGLKMWVKLYHDCSPKDSLNWGWAEQVNGFVSGMTPFLIQDPDTVPIVERRLGDPNLYGVAPMPVGPYGKVYLDYGNAGWGIASYSKYKNEAWELIKFLSSPEVNARFSKFNGSLPISKSAF
ncbi:MAG: sugar ABC transporter substrate-binding protein, partial [Pseudothermotoga sp.]|nr:sugar ABC transporter substrate-binding protein [Pseudothermotoga sp.]